MAGSTWCMCGLAGYGSTLLLGWLEALGACVVWLAMAAHCCWCGWKLLVHVWSGWLWQHIVVGVVGSTWCMCGLAGYGSTLLLGWLEALGACVVWLAMVAHCCWCGWKLLVHVWSGWLWQHIVVGVVGSTWCMCGLAGYGSTLFCLLKLSDSILRQGLHL